MNKTKTLADAKLWCIVPCAGTGARSGAELPKQYVQLAGVAVVTHTLKALQEVKALSGITVVISPKDELFKKYCPEFDGSIAPIGGETRAQSVRAGLDALTVQGANEADWVLVHDAARCLLKPEWVDQLINECFDDEVGGLLAQPVPDTLKQMSGGRSVATIERQDKWLAQTPQMFRIGMLKQALDEAAEKCITITDEASSIEALGLHPKLVECSADNFKLTYPQDFERALSILKARTNA